MNLKDLCSKYDLSKEAYEHLKIEVSKTRKGMPFRVMRDWINDDYFIFKNLKAIEI